MLNKKEVMERYAGIRKFTAQYSGLDVILVEEWLREIAETCTRAVDLLEDNNISTG